MAHWCLTKQAVQWLLNRVKFNKDSIDEQELRLQQLEQMAITNNWYAPVTVTDNESILLVDDNNNAILADWKYKEV